MFTPLNQKKILSIFEQFPIIFRFNFEKSLFSVGK